MLKKSGKTYEELQHHIVELIEQNEVLNRELIKTWRDVLELAGTNQRLFNENQRLIQLYRSPESDRDLVAA